MRLIIPFEPQIIRVEDVLDQVRCWIHLIQGAPILEKILDVYIAYNEDSTYDKRPEMQEHNMSTLNCMLNDLAPWQIVAIENWAHNAADPVNITVSTKMSNQNLSLEVGSIHYIHWIVKEVGIEDLARS